MKKYIILPIVSLITAVAVLGGLHAESSDKPDIVHAAMDDDRFVVKNFSFFKRHSIKGGGQELNVTFEIFNNTDITIDMKMMLLAYYEEDGVDDKLRNLEAYPKWRNKDIEKQVKIIRNLDTIPIFKDEEADAKSNVSRYGFAELVNTMQKDIELGQKLSIRGIAADARPVIADDKFYIDMQPLRTMVIGKLYVPFSANIKFFNTFGVILKDEESGEVIYSQVIRFKRPLRVY
ncbi:MAG: hypothetical protein ABUK01_06525 [Leptospirales bacterium]